MSLQIKAKLFGNYFSQSVSMVESMIFRKRSGKSNLQFSHSDPIRLSREFEAIPHLIGKTLNFGVGLHCSHMKVALRQPKKTVLSPGVIRDAIHPTVVPALTMGIGKSQIDMDAPPTERRKNARDLPHPLYPSSRIRVLEHANRDRCRLPSL